MNLRTTAVILAALVVSYSCGFLPFWMGSISLLLLGLFILPFLAYSDGLINKIWGSSISRSIATVRTVWLFLWLHGIGWKEIVFCAITHELVQRVIMILNYLLFHRTLFQHIKGSQWDLAIDFSAPINVVQLTGCEALTALILRRFLNVQLPMLSLIVLSMSSFWFERIIAQTMVYSRHKESDGGTARVFFTHWGPSADSGHWLLQVEGFIIHIFKRDGQVTAKLERPHRAADKRDDHPIPSLQHAIYIPFRQYGIVGVTDENGPMATMEEWRGFVEDCMDRYSSANRSCQEFVIFTMYHLCTPPFFNMSDLKSLGPLAIGFIILHGDMVRDVARDVCAAFPEILKKVAGEIFF